MNWRTLAILLLPAATLTPASALAQDSVESLREQLRRTEQQLHAVTQRLDALERQQREAPPARPQPATADATRPALPSAAPPGTAAAGARSELPTRESVSDPSSAASRQDSAPSPTDPELKGFISIPGTETMIRLGGYAKLDAMWDNHPAGDADQFVTSEFPVGPGQRDVPNFHMHAKQTRFNIEARRPTSRGTLRFYLENDFFGSPDGYEFRLRHAYGQLGNTYAGYGYSSFMDADSLPNTLDFEGPGSAPYLLVAGIHQIIPIGKGNTFTVAAESPDTQLDNVTGDDLSVQRAPDVTLALRMERKWGHLQLSTVARSLGYDGAGGSETKVGGGAQLSGSYSIGDKGDLLVYGLVGGRGIARYITDIGGSGLDAVIDATGELKLLKSYGGFFGYTHNWTSKWSSNLVYGELKLDGDNLLAADDFRRSKYGAVNLLWSPSSSWTMGVELLYGQLQIQDGSDADVMRLQGSVQYSFIK